jgi:tetratricopeptide (TPR) repeat protein
MHRLKETEQVVDNALTFAPDNPLLLVFRAFLTLYLEGDTKALRADIEKVNRFAPRSFAALYQETMDIFLRHYDSALARCPQAEYYQDDTAGFYNGRGNIYRFMGNDSLSRTYYDSARAVCEKWSLTQPDNPRVYEQLAVAHAGLSQKDEAVQCAKRATELMPLSKDALSGADAIQNLAIVYIMVGEYESAIDQLEVLLSIPSMMDVAVLRLHPGLDPLRDHPRFQALLKKHGNNRNN